MNAPAYLGKYQIDMQLGMGAHGRVFKAYDDVLKRFVALKGLKFPESVSKKQLLREARPLASLRHPHIVTLYEVFEAQDQLFLVIEYIEGTSLADHLKETHLSLETALELIDQLADALASAHDKKIIHGDIKPSNIMLDTDGASRLIDFGLAKITHQQNLLMTLSNSDEDYETLKTAAEFESLSGTLPYLAPERLSGGAANISGDMFALGAVFYEMLTGESAFATENFGATLNRILNEDPLEIAPLPSHFPESVSDLVRQMLHKDPAQRFKSMSAFRHALAAIRGTTAQPSFNTLRPRHRYLPYIIGGMVICLLSIGFLSYRTGVISEPVSLRVQRGLTYIQNFEETDAIDNAQALFSTLLTEKPGHAAGHAGMALALMRDYTSRETDPATLKRATNLAQAALESDPHLALSHIAAGWAEEFNGRLESALTYYDTADMLDPQNPLTLEGRGRTLKKQGDYEGAAELFKGAIEVYPENHVLLNEYANALQRMGRHEEAGKAYEKSITLKPDNIYSYVGLSYSLYFLDDTAGSIKIIQNGLTIKKHPELYTNLGTYLFFSGRYEEAATAYEQALSFEGNSHNYLYWANLGDAYRWSQGQERKAILAFERAIQLIEEKIIDRPKNSSMNSRLALYSSKVKNLDKANNAINIVLGKENISSRHLYRIMTALEIIGRRDAALDILRQLLIRNFSLSEVENDPEFTALRQDPSYHQILTTTSNP